MKKVMSNLIFITTFFALQVLAHASVAKCPSGYGIHRFGDNVSCICEDNVNIKCYSNNEFVPAVFPTCSSGYSFYTYKVDSGPDYADQKIGKCLKKEPESENYEDN